MICSWTQRALAMGFSNSESHPAGFEDASLDLSTCLTMKSPTRSLEKPTIEFSRCLSKKRPSHGPSVRLRWAFPPAGRGKGHLLRKEEDQILVHCEPCI